MRIVTEHMTTGEKKTLADGLKNRSKADRETTRNLVTELRRTHERAGWVVYAE